MHLYLEGTVKDVNSIRYSSAESMRQRGVEVFPSTQVLEIFPEKHEIKVKDLKSNEERIESYDRLILGAGMSPNIPQIEGLDLKNVKLFGGRDSAELLRYKEVNPAIEDVVIIGGGYIALEAAMCFAKAGKKVTMLNRGERLISTHLDKEMTDILTAEIEANGIDFKGNIEVEKLLGEDGKVKSVVTKQGEFPAQLVIISIGNHPNTGWLKDKIKLNERGFIIVDDYMQSSAKDVFAAGGATLMKYNPIDGYINVDLATNARKQGRIAAKNLNGEVFPYIGMQGTSALKVYDYSFASTGLNAGSAERTELSWDSVYVESLALDEYVPEEMNAKVYAKLIYDKDSRRVLGGQILSKKDLTGSIQALSMVIQAKFTIDDLAFADFFFQPLFNRPWNILNVLGLEAQKKEA
ncbi:MAG: FAD-dependent oxidoreductase [Eubacteriales bacterium]|nr:FAD-dependent oxidoreductase [Eubacteriales bacterium]